MPCRSASAHASASRRRCGPARGSVTACWREARPGRHRRAAPSPRPGHAPAGAPRRPGRPRPRRGRGGWPARSSPRRRRVLGGVGRSSRRGPLDPRRPSPMQQDRAEGRRGHHATIRRAARRQKPTSGCERPAHQDGARAGGPEPVRRPQPPGPPGRWPGDRRPGHEESAATAVVDADPTGAARRPGASTGRAGDDATNEPSTSRRAAGANATSGSADGATRWPADGATNAPADGAAKQHADVAAVPPDRPAADRPRRGDARSTNIAPRSARRTRPAAVADPRPARRPAPRHQRAARHPDALETRRRRSGGARGGPPESRPRAWLRSAPGLIPPRAARASETRAPRAGSWRGPCPRRRRGRC